MSESNQNAAAIIGHLRELGEKIKAAQDINTKVNCPKVTDAEIRTIISVLFQGSTLTEIKCRLLSGNRLNNLSLINGTPVNNEEFLKDLLPEGITEYLQTFQAPLLEIVTLVFEKLRNGNHSCEEEGSHWFRLNFLCYVFEYFIKNNWLYELVDVIETNCKEGNTDLEWNQVCQIVERSSGYERGDHLINPTAPERIQECLDIGNRSNWESEILNPERRLFQDGLARALARLQAVIYLMALLHEQFSVLHDRISEGKSA